MKLSVIAVDFLIPTSPTYSYMQHIYDKWIENGTNSSVSYLMLDRSEQDNFELGYSMNVIGSIFYLYCYAVAAKEGYGSFWLPDLAVQGMWKYISITIFSVTCQDVSDKSKAKRASAQMGEAQTSWLSLSAWGFNKSGVL